MDETISDPIATQRVALHQLDQDLATLGRVAADMRAMLRRAGEPATAAGAVTGLVPALEEHLRLAQVHGSAAGRGLDAIERAAESRRQEAHHLRTLYTIGQAVNATLNLRDLLNVVMDNVIDVTKAERGYVVLRDEQTGELTVAAARGIDKAAIDD